MDYAVSWTEPARRSLVAVSLEEISEEMAIMAGILAGQADIDAGRYVTQAEAVRRSETWITKPSNPGFAEPHPRATVRRPIRG